MVAEAVTGKRAKFVRALVAGQDIRQAAATAEVSERTGYRWLRSEPVQEALGRVLDAELSALAARTLKMASPAPVVLGRMMQAPDTADYVRLGAAKALLDAALRLFELRVLSERLSRVEARLAEQGVKT